MKNIIIFVVVVAGAYFAWNYSPGLRDQVTKAANKYGGWNEEARKSDPVGYIEYAIEQLDKDVDAFGEARADLMATKKSSEAKLEEARDKGAKATSFANQIKEQFSTAEETGGWPITLNGKSYDKDSTITLVNDVLLAKKNSAMRVTDYEGIIANINARTAELSTRISESKFNKDSLMAQKDIVKVGTMNAKTDELLAKVNDLVEGNHKLDDEDLPTTFDDLVKDIDKTADAAEKAAADAEANSMALDFLNG